MISDEVVEHYQRLWGAPSRTARFRKGEHTVYIHKWDKTTHPDEVYFYATAGASNQPVPGIDPLHRFEIFIGFTAEVDDIASTLASTALDPVLHGSSLQHGHSITYPEPLWPGTGMNTILLVQQTEDEIVPRIQATNGKPHVEFMQLMPLFPSEVVYRRKHGTEGLLEMWSEKRVPYWNPHRQPEPRG
ncbi:MAG TPA: suppressor of fused domain protein [Thermoanaerobaculia bacterium]|nr:suppressor of fused domain protein [Thermoanaerobaculia bacterium]